MDIVTERNVQKERFAFLESLGYETLHVFEGYSNHAHGDPALGRVNVVHVDDDTASKLLDEAGQIEIFAGSKALVPRAKYLIAMKVLAARNDPTRRLREMADMADLLLAREIAPDDAKKPRHGALLLPLDRPVERCLRDIVGSRNNRTAETDSGPARIRAGALRHRDREPRA